PLFILIGEDHLNSESLLMELMILRIAEILGIKQIFLEASVEDQKYIEQHRTGESSANMGFIYSLSKMRGQVNNFFDDPQLRELNVNENIEKRNFRMVNTLAMEDHYRTRERIEKFKKETSKTKPYSFLDNAGKKASKQSRDMLFYGSPAIGIVGN